MKQNYQRAFALLTLLFFMWGFITVTNDVLVNGFKQIFDLSPVKRAFVQQSFFGAFFIVSLAYFLYSSLTGRDPVNRFGYHRGMVAGLIVCGLGCLMFYPAALVESYLAFLGALFVLAIGVAILQICANPYAAILGSPETAGSRLNLAQGFNSLGTTLGPLVGFILIYKVFSDGNPSAVSISVTYALYGGVFLLLALLTALSSMPGFRNSEESHRDLQIVKNPRVLMGVLAIFFYVGSEVSVGTWLVEYLKSPRGGGFTEEAGSYFLAYFWGGLMIGRLSGAVIFSSAIFFRRILGALLAAVVVLLMIYLVTSVVKSETGFSWSFRPISELGPYALAVAVMMVGLVSGRGNPAKTLLIFSTVNVALFSVIAFGFIEAGLWFAVSSGLFFSIGWSNIFSISIRGLGSRTSQASSLLVLAIVGGAVLPGIQAGLMDTAGVSGSFLVPALGMTFVALFAYAATKFVD